MAKKLFFKWIFVFSIFIILSYFVIGSVAGSSSKDFNIPIYIQTSAGIEKANYDEIIDTLFNRDFDIEEKQEYVPDEKCSLRAKAGSLEIGEMIFDSKNGLSFNIPLKNDGPGKGSLIVEKEGNRFSLSFEVQEILKTDSKKLIFRAVGKGKLNKEELNFYEINVTFDKINNIVEITGKGKMDFQIKDMKVTFTEGCYREEQKFYLITDNEELKKGRSIEEVRGILDEHPEFLDVYWNLEKLYKDYWWEHIPHVNVGSIWTTRDDCGDYSQNVNQYDIGEHVYVNGENFKPGDYDWAITGQPGQASCNPSQIVASGSYEVNKTGAFCFDAYTVQQGDCKEYKVDFNSKHDNYYVIPEFNFAIGILIALSAIGIFFFVRRK